jgi:hypothetical protein
VILRIRADVAPAGVTANGAAADSSYDAVAKTLVVRLLLERGATTVVVTK